MTKNIIKSLVNPKTALFLGLALFSLLFPITTQAQIKLRTVADWEAGSIVLLNGYKFVKLNGPGGDGYFMAMEPLCDIPDADSIIIDQAGEGTDPTFTLSISNATGIGPSCTWTATTSDGSPVTPNWTTLPDASGRTTGCTIQVPKLTEETIFTPTITGCNMGGDLSTDLTIKTAPQTTTEVTDEYITSMPSCTQDSCPADATIEAIDDRDGKQYTLRKLPDGKLWMVDNLAYGGSTDSCANKTTFSGNGSSSYTNQFGTNTYGDCIDPAVAPMASGHTRQCGPGGTLTDQCGYLYNWQAAMQHQSAYYNTSYSGPQTNVTGLCPAGFTLPTRDDFIALDTSLGGTGQNSQTTASLIARYTNPALYNGIFSGGSSDSGFLSEQGTFGFWWSSTQHSSSFAYHLSLYSSNVNPQYSSRKFNGVAVRCIKDPTIRVTTSELTEQYISTMPSCTQDECPYGATVEMTDERDGKAYTLRKLPDGKLWMVDNLAYGGSSDSCANRTTFSGDGSASYTNRFGSGTYGDCIDPATDVGEDCAAGGALAGKCGYLYNWQAAMQNPLAHWNGGTSISQDNVTGLCPTGFTLPTSGNFTALDIEFGGTGANRSVDASDPVLARWRNTNLYNGIFSGYSSPSGSLVYQGSYGYWWSSMGLGNNSARHLYLNSSNVYPDYNDYRAFGFAVRCLK